VGLTQYLGRGPVGVDTAVFIYFIQADPDWCPIIRPVFEAADSGRLTLVTSAVTLLEVLVIPYRTNDQVLADRYDALLTRSRGIRLIDVTRAQLVWAARLRAATRVRTPDALQLAAASQAGCPVFLTNDRRLPAVPGMRIVQLSQMRAQ
jgi:predicted nucleic acid-binding protein